MKFIEVWGETQKQNQFLKILLFLSCGALTSAGVGVYKLSMKTPLILERGCFTKPITPKSIDFTNQEMEGFLKQAISYRFDTEVQPISEFFSDEELAARNKEQSEFSKKGISQIIYVHNQSPKISGNQVTFEAERIFILGSVRSTLPLSLEATISVQPRTDANPYGIRIENLKEIKLDTKNLKSEVAR